MGWGGGGSGCPLACALGGGFAPGAGMMDGWEPTRSEEAPQPLRGSDTGD